MVIKMLCCHFTLTLVYICQYVSCYLSYRYDNLKNCQFGGSFQLRFDLMSQVNIVRLVFSFCFQSKLFCVLFPPVLSVVLSSVCIRITCVLLFLISVMIWSSLFFWTLLCFTFSDFGFSFFLLLWLDFLSLFTLCLWPRLCFLDFGCFCSLEIQPNFWPFVSLLDYLHCTDMCLYEICLLHPDWTE